MNVYNRKTGIALLLVLIILGVGLGASFYLIKGRGKVATYGCVVYTDSTRSKTLTEIDWGLVELQKIYRFYAYLVNTGNVAQNYTFSNENSVPANFTDYVTMGWNYTGFLIQPNEGINFYFTFSVSVDCPYGGDFSFDIVIQPWFAPTIQKIVTVTIP